MQFAGGEAAGPWYPSDGVGAVSTTATDSTVADWEETRILQVHAPHPGARTDIAFYHQIDTSGAGTLAYKMTFKAADQFQILHWPKGLLLIGSWRVLFSGTTHADETWHIQYERG